MTNTPAPFDAASFRKLFPALVDGAAHFDGPGGSQTPQPVIDAISSVLAGPLANRGSVTQAERNAEAAVQGARQAIADLLGATADGVIFGRSMTALTFDMSRTLARTWAPGDEVVVSRLDHDGNVRPWVLAAEAAGAVVKWAEFDPATGELPPDAIGALLTDRTRLVAVTAASNLIGTKPDVAAIGRLVHDAGALLYVDGVHFTAHTSVDVGAIGCDFYACSPYKFLGPHCGVVFGKPAVLETLRPDKLLPATNDVPERFELGTLPYEQMAGTTAAIDLLAEATPGSGTRRERLVASMHAIEEYEDSLRLEIEQRLAALPGFTCYSRASRRTPTLLVEFAGHASSDVYRFLGTRGVNAPAGSFYAYEASHHIGLGDTGALRIGLAPYNTLDDVDRLFDALNELLG